MTNRMIQRNLARGGRISGVQTTQFPEYFIDPVFPELGCRKAHAVGIQVAFKIDPRLGKVVHRCKRGERHLDVRSDLYSLGCMVFEMLAGRPPFTGTSTMQVVAQRFTSVVPDLGQEAPHLPAGVGQCVARAMSPARGSSPC